jgi:hypothetical protein
MLVNDATRCSLTVCRQSMSNGIQAARLNSSRITLRRVSSRLPESFERYSRKASLIKAQLKTSVDFE